MTLRERLRIIGLAIRTGSLPTVKEIVKEKGVGAGFFDFKPLALVSPTTASEKLLHANQGWVYKNNDVVAREVAQIEFELFTVKQVGKEIEFDPVLQHPVLDALDRFNEFTSASDGFYITQSHKSLAGDAFWYVPHNGIEIEGIYPLQPDKVKLELGKPTPGKPIIKAYIYKDSVEGEQVEERYSPDDIIQFKNPNPENPFRGKSKVEAAADSIDTDNLAIEANKGQFKRGFISNFFLGTDKSLTSDQIKELEAQMRKYTGSENSFKVPVFGGGVEPKPVQLTARDMEFIAQQTWLRDKIMSIFGNNRAVLGITDDVNRANAEASILNWKRTTVKAEMKQITDTLNEFFVPLFGTNMLLGFKDPVPEDKVEKTEVITKLVTASVVSINEAREELGYDPVEGGDELGFQRQERQQKEQADQVAQQVARTAPKSVLNISYMKALRRTGVFTKVATHMQLKQAAKPIARRMIAERKKHEAPAEHEAFTNEKVWSFHNKQIRIVEAQEEIFENKVIQFVNGMVERALSRLPEELADQQKALLNETDEITMAMIDFTPILNEVAIMSGIEALQFIGDDDPYIPTDLRAVIERSVRKFAKSMVETDRQILTDIIAEGLAQGDSVTKIRNAINKKFAEFTKSQARKVTRTEVIRASNYGALDAWQQSDVVVAKQWLTALDDRTDPLCEYMNGKIIPMSKNFFDKGETLNVGDSSTKFDYGSVKVPPLHPNCRCTLLPVLDRQNQFDTVAYVRVKGLETDKARLEDELTEMDKRTKEAKVKQEELQGYIAELEDYLDAKT